jgi:hypothetical protein
MTTISLDAIVRNFIMKRRYSFHWYMEFLVYATECLRELSMDDLKVVNTMKLAVDSNTNAVDLPHDYMDYIEVGIQTGQTLKPLVETDKINPLVARTSNFTPTTYGELSAAATNNVLYYGSLYPYYWNTVFWNSNGEFTGRLFGFGAGGEDDVFSVFPERNQIQLSERLSLSYIVLRYISDGMNSDAATQISPYAYQTISNYIYWQMKEHTRTYSDAEAERARQLYINERLILRARLSDLTTEKLKRAFQKATYSSPKSM